MTEIEVIKVPYNSQIHNQNNIRKLTPFKNYIDKNGIPILYILKDFYNKLQLLEYVTFIDIENIDDKIDDTISWYYHDKTNHDLHKYVTDWPEYNYLNKESYEKLSGKHIFVCDNLPIFESNDDKGYWIVYRQWCRAYNAEVWYTALGKQVELIKLTIDEKHTLTGLKEITDNIVAETPVIQTIIDKLKHHISILQKNMGIQELFIKTSAKSTKHDVPVQPITDAVQALNYLLSSDSIQSVLKRDEPVYLLLRPWNTEINNDNEIRVFIQNGHIKAISQQYIYDSSPIMGMLMTYNSKDIIDKIKSKWDSMSNLKYSDAVLDMFINGDGDAELIEVNCGGNGWGPAGSSLFTWDEINSIPYGKCILAYN